MQGQELAETGIAIGLPKGTYARIALRSGLASKKEIAIKGVVINANYRREVKVLMVNQGKNNSRIQPGYRITKLIIEKIDTSDVMEVDDVEITERAERGFGSTNMSPKGTMSVIDCKPMICFLQANHEDSEYFDAEDMGRHPRLLKDHIVMSSAIISQVERKNFDADCIT